LDYVKSTGTGVLASFTRLQHSRSGEEVALDATTQRNLELLETIHGDHDGSLLQTIDHTVTSMGGRKLREWITRPIRDIDEIERRQGCISALADSPLSRDAIKDLLKGTTDPARIAARSINETATPSDLHRLKQALETLPEIRKRITNSQELAQSPLGDLHQDFDAATLAELRDELDAALVSDPPETVSEGGVFQRGYDENLDEVIDRHQELKSYFESLADRESRKHGLRHVTVDRNSTDGYYIQVGKSAADDVPEHYREIKTLKNSKRFTTDDVEDHERDLLRIEERRAAHEERLFKELRDAVSDRAPTIQAAAKILAELDVLLSLAEHATLYDWVKPEFSDRGLQIDQGRHPVVEQTVEFVPNDAHLSEDRKFLIVTGPNMSGKSTYMRQVALIVLLGQIGSFVPADAAQIDPVDGIFTRVGALDELAGGRSTFMVEMQELAHILHAATSDSLVILDEVGRGTATYDGVSIAWAATEYLHNTVNSYTLFATHYHELTNLGERLERVANVHVAAEEHGEDVTFLRTVTEGSTDRSYGIHVADLAGVPNPVVSRSRDVLDRLRNEMPIQAKGDSTDNTTQAVFDLSAGEFQDSTNSSEGDTDTIDPATESVVEELVEVDVNEVSPIELMAKVQEWQRELERD
ncbi:MAG: DNA mismatch repair protein MutS, partial [Halobacteriaceae archaeon]